MNKFALVLCLLAFLGSVLASPKIQDIHKTSLDLYAVGKLHEHGRFAVSVKRVDDLVDVAADGTVKPIAERITDVIVMFDVDKMGKVSVNNVPVQMGVSKLKVEAAMVVGVTKNAGNMTKEEIQKAFDVGIVGIEVKATGEQVTIAGISITRIILVERILEINGVEVTQNDAVQQIFEIGVDGSVNRHRPTPCGSAPSTPGMKPAAPSAPMAFHSSSSTPSSTNSRHSRPSCFRAMKARVSKWFQEQPMPAKIGISMFFGAVLGCLALLTLRLITLFFGLGSSRRSSEDSFDDDDESGRFIKRVSFASDDKLPFAIVYATPTEESDELPAYNSSGYAPVANNEETKQVSA